jgi:dihydroorotase
VSTVIFAGGRVIDPSQNLDEITDVAIVDGKIDALGRGLAAPHTSNLEPRLASAGQETRSKSDASGLKAEVEIIDCSGLIVSPGFIDVHCHLREPGREDVETIATGATAAGAGGFTAVCAMPNTDPVTDNQAAVGFVVRQSQLARMARVYPIGAISVGQKGESLAEFGEMIAAGAVALSDDGKPVASAHLMRTALEYARTFDVPVADHCEEPTLATGGAMNEGVVSMRLGLKGIPSEAEEIMAIRDILLARRTGGHVHLCHMSTRGSVELITWGKDRGIRVTAEVCPHHLSLTEDAVGEYNTNAKMNPPLRTADDVEALQQAVKDGVIDVIATDHAPHHYDEKEREFADAPNGIIGLETALAVNLTWLVKPGIVALPTLIDRMSCAPARIFHLPGGGLKKGGPADITVFDPAVSWVVNASRFRTKGRNTPYEGMTLTGRVHYTMVHGRIIHRGLI